MNMTKEEKVLNECINDLGEKMNGLRKVQVAWTRGYMSRRDGAKAYDYDGKYGKGIMVEYPSWGSTIYHKVAYFVEG